ncbi:MAG TPA: hypothetical protein VMV17_19645 [Streptosporangiaceae bacterium]|nr:hypothetical protein [Streptosporangiaceae bacterium]
MTVVVISLGAVILLAAGYAVGGQVGLFAVVALAAAAGLLAARLRIPAPVSRPSPTRQVQHPNAAFTAYRRIETALDQGRMSRRLFDHTARPLLYRLLGALLADRRRLDITSDIRAAREAVGEDLWPLLDRARPASDDSREPGPGAQTLARIVDRLEDL